MRKIIAFSIILSIILISQVFADNYPYYPIPGNLHIHTKNSEKARQFGSLSKIATIAKPINYYDHFISEGPNETCVTAKFIGLRLIGLSDHGCALTHPAWQGIQKSCLENSDNGFIALRGFEWTADGYNHINCFNSNNFCSANAQFATYGLIGIDQKIITISNLKDFYIWLAKESIINPNLVCQYNHPSDAKGIFNNFQTYGKPIDDFMALIELGSGPEIRHTTIIDNLPCYIQALQAGRWLAPTNGIDNFGPITKKEARNRHTTVWMEKNLPLTMENIASALLQRKTCASDDANCLIKFWAVSEESQDKYYLGDKLNIRRGNGLNLYLEIEDKDEPIGEIKILEIRKNKYFFYNFSQNKLIDKKFYLGNKVCYPISDTLCYLIIVKQADGDYIITAPIGTLVTIPDVIAQYEYNGNDPLQMLYHTDDFKYKLIICDYYQKNENGKLTYREKSVFNYKKDDIHIISQPKNLTKRYKLPCYLKIIIYNQNGEILEKHVLKITNYPIEKIQLLDKRISRPKGTYFVEGYVNNDLFERKQFQIR